VSPVRTTAQAVQQPLRVRVDLREGTTLRAAVALEQRGVAVAVHRDRPPVFDGHDDRAHRSAQPTRTRLRGGHTTSQPAVSESYPPCNSCARGPGRTTRDSTNGDNRISTEARRA